MVSNKPNRIFLRELRKSLARPAASIALPIFVSLLVVSAPLKAGEPAITPAIQAIIDSPDRSEDDRETDQRRHPAKMLAFIGVKPGIREIQQGS